MSSISKAESILEKAFRNGRLHHAILLYGNSATALEDVAKKTASLLFGRPCARHPDLFELRPEGKMRLIKIGSASDRTGGDWPPNTMRKLLRDIRQSPSAGAVKVALATTNQKSFWLDRKLPEERPNAIIGDFSEFSTGALRALFIS